MEVITVAEDREAEEVETIITTAVAAETSGIKLEVTVSTNSNSEKMNFI